MSVNPTQLRTRIYQFLQLDSTTTVSTVLDGWIVRAVTNLAQLIKAEKKSWDVLAPLIRTHSGQLSDACLLEKPTDFIEIITGDVQGRAIAKFVRKDMLSVSKDEILQPTYGEVWVVTDDMADTDEERSTTDWIVWPTIYGKYDFSLTYVGVPAGTEEYSTALADVLQYGASVIGAGILQDFNKLTIAEQKYRESLALLLRST